MDIGTEEPAITVEPVEDPFRREAPAPSQPDPVRVPVKVPDEELTPA